MSVFSPYCNMIPSEVAIKKSEPLCKSSSLSSEQNGVITIQCLLIDAWFVPRLPNAYQICCTIKLHQYSNGIEPSDDLFVLLAVRPPPVSCSVVIPLCKIF